MIRTTTKALLLSISIMFGMISCQTKTTQTDKPAQEATSSDNHSVIVKEVIQTSKYTYFKVSENEKEFWIAGSLMEAKPGDKLYYIGGMEMTNFESKELNRKFESIFFIDKISTQPIAAQPQAQPGQGGQQSMGNQPVKPQPGREEVKIDAAKGGITVAELFSNRSKYDGKNVKIKGKVVKWNEGIMNTNWAHIQDGTKDGENFDLTVTTNDVVAVGDVVTFNGKIQLKKDFGAGYFYEVIMLDSKLVK